MAFFVFSVLSDFSLDDPGFTPRFLLCLLRRYLRLKFPLIVVVFVFSSVMVAY